MVVVMAAGDREGDGKARRPQEEVYWGKGRSEKRNETVIHLLLLLGTTNRPPSDTATSSDV